MTIYSLGILFSRFETSLLFHVTSNRCFLTCIHISQEAGKVVWYSHLFKSFPQFVVIHTVKGFGTVSKAEVNVFLELSCFFESPDVGNLISVFNFPVSILVSRQLQLRCSFLSMCSWTHSFYDLAPSPSSLTPSNMLLCWSRWGGRNCKVYLHQG